MNDVSFVSSKILIINSYNPSFYSQKCIHPLGESKRIKLPISSGLSYYVESHEVCMQSRSNQPNICTNVYIFGA